MYDESANYFGMHVKDAWDKGYNGSGVTIAVIDIGVIADINDIRKNLNMDLAYNFIDKTTNVTPGEISTNYRAESMRLLSHGIQCTSIIVAEKGNELCNAGIAFEGKAVPFKVFWLLHEYHVFKVHTADDIIAAALTYGLEDIHIYSNSWSSPPTKFSPLGLGMREAILYGVTNGRKKRGSIYVFPDGSDGITGNGAANSIYTIAVNNVGVRGTLLENHEVSACVITSGLGNGNSLHTNFMMTSSYNNACVGSFKGVSAAVAEVSAIIALVLQARPDLTYRDIQQVLAEASEREGLAESSTFTPNAAGKYFHPVFGFGLLNADKAVTIAKSWRHVGTMFSDSLDHVKKHTFQSHHRYSITMMTIITFNMEEDPCRHHVNTIEHVVLQIPHDVINQRGVSIEIVSPSMTPSIVLDTKDGKNIDQDTSPRRLASVHFLGESPIGYWMVRIQFKNQLVEIPLESVSLTVYGTYDDSKRNHPKTCSPPPEKPPTPIHKENATKKKHETTNHHRNTPETDHTAPVKNSASLHVQSQHFILYFVGLLIVNRVLQYMCIS
ncbi:neuroendocrine convertase 2-like [Ruditapes philippinarum]|uniref:neuroendocrine convertase 2-like n=1 Tax=Ruditapes philippinarum TaxID=129788 RepID=UPI00295AEFBA|nr:neuroendocrine convertase 2-like [Ruditapes philippinarum]